MKTIAHCSQKDMHFGTNIYSSRGPKIFRLGQMGKGGGALTFAINNLSGFKNGHKYHVMNKTNITVCTCVYIYIYIYLCVCVCVCVCKGRSIPNHVTFGLRKMLQNPKSYYLRNLPMYTTPFETPVIIIP